MNAFARAAAALVADQNLGTAITYCPASAPRIDCRVIFARPVQEFGQAVSAGLMASVSAADVAAPERGDTILTLAAMRVGTTSLSAGTMLIVEKATADESLAMYDLTLSISA